MGPIALLVAAACVTPGAAGSLPVSGSLLRGDVDGDGVRDEAAVRYIPRAPASCGFLLSVHTRRRAYSVPIRTVPGKALTTTEAVRNGEAPALEVLAEITRQPGAELLVRLVRGASDHSGSVYTLTRGRLHRMEIEGAWDGQFRWWGSVAHNGNVDCLGGRQSGRVATRGAGLGLSGLTESRSIYVVDDLQFRRVRSRWRFGLRPGQAWFTDIPDVGIGPPFRQCTVAATADP